MSADEYVLVTAIFCEVEDRADTITLEEIETLAQKRCEELSGLLSNPDHLAIARHVWAAITKSDRQLRY